MLGKIKTAIDLCWLKIRHPKVNTSGVHHIRKGTEIVIVEDGSIFIGEGVSTHCRVTFSVVGGKLSIGDNTSFNRNSIIVCHKEIIIGGKCSFGPNLVMYDHDHIFDRTGFKKGDYHTDSISVC